LKRVIRSDDFLSDEYKEILRRADTSDWAQMQTERQQDEIDRAGGYDRYLRKEHDRARKITSAIRPFKTKYEVHWISPDGKDCLLGGSNDLEEANEIACEQAKEIFESPFETNERKFHFLQELYVVELPSEKDAMLTDTEDYIDNLMSEIDSRM